MTTVRTTSDQSADALLESWRRLPALSGIAFAVLLLLGFFLSGSDTPDYAESDQVWRAWSDDYGFKSRVGALLTLVAGLVFLHFAATIRSVLARAETAVRGSGQLSQVAFAGALTGITGITMAVVMIAGATAVGGDPNPVVSRAVATATVGPFLFAAMGFAAWLTAAGLTTLRSGAFPRWVGIVALLGGAAFTLTFFTLTVGPDKDSVFGYGFFVGFLAVATWSTATSVLTYRAMATAIPDPAATAADS